MMKPNFDDVIEYVKAGEDDPDMEETLSLHPNGQEFLKQARFICKVLEHQPETADDSGLAARFDSRAVVSLESMREFPRRMPSASLRSAPRRTRRSQSIWEMISGYGPETDDLGTLEFAEERESVAVSYQPSARVMRRYGKTSDAFEFAQANIDGIEIRGRNITFTLPERLPAGQPALLRVARGLKRLPVARLELTFMPDAGPFVRVATSVKGIAQLPVPDQSGTLLIAAANQSTILHLKLKK